MISKLRVLLIGAMFSFVPAVGHAALIGSTSGPDSSYTINMFFQNTGASDILSLTLDGTTATSAQTPIVWDSVGTFNTSTAAAPTSVVGVNTSVVTFSWGAAGFGSGAAFNLLQVDPDGSVSNSVTIIEMLGVTVTALFADQSVFSGVFVDDLAAGAGLVLAPVPLPAALPLFAAALGGAGFIARRRRRAASSAAAA